MRLRRVWRIPLLKMSDPYAKLELSNQRRENLMNDYDDLEDVMTNTKCVTCNDKLTVWEDTYCILCEGDGF